MNDIIPSSSDMRSEGIQFALNFLRNRDLTPQEIAEDGKRAVDILTDRLKQISDARGMTTFLMGGVLHKLRENDMWQGVSWPGQDQYWVWADFVRNILGKSPAWAGIIEKIWVKSQVVDLKEEEIEHMGWACTNEVLRIAQSREDVDFWIEKFDQAETSKGFLKEVRTALNKKLDEGEIKPAPIQRSFNFRDEEQLRVFDECMEKAARMMGRVVGLNTGQQDCLLFILTQWRMFVADQREKE